MEAGNKIRPRAITTTMFSRLFFSDVFIHGIGGAKYDTITDEIIKRILRYRPSPPSSRFLRLYIYLWMPMILMRGSYMTYKGVLTI